MTVQERMDFLYAEYLYYFYQPEYDEVVEEVVSDEIEYDN